MPDLRAQLRDCLRGRVAFLGLGSRERGDDGFGVRLAERLAAAGVPDVVDAGTAPERCLRPTVDGGCDHVVFLDAVDFGREPGAVVFLDAAGIAARYPQISTHKISLGLLARAVEAAGPARAWLLGVQPSSLQAGAALTPAVQTTLELLAELLVELGRATEPRLTEVPA
ncbi:MAG TPA: hydrogenase maturation protease [Opitutaceae bacterium]|nr:hydrogenase maturation protease [Opitutaceae bacterium]